MKRFIANLNVFIPCVILLGMTTGIPVANAISLVWYDYLYVDRLLFITYLIIALTLAVFWWKIGLSPDNRKSGRERRYKIGHVVLALANTLAVSELGIRIIAVDVAKIFYGGEIVGFSHMAYMLALSAWPVGLFMVWSSRD